MNAWSDLYAALHAYLPALIAVAVVVVPLLWLVDRLIIGQQTDLGAKSMLPRQLLMFVWTHLPHPNPSPGGRGALNSLLPPGEGLGMRETRLQCSAA